MKPQRIQLSRKKGFNLQAASKALNGLPAVKCDRSTPWGNRWSIGDFSIVENKVLDAADVVRKHREFIESRPITQEIIQENLSGLNLACWCKPGQPCHADVLLEIANR